jgi:quinol monooxygenase YgiN
MIHVIAEIELQPGRREEFLALFRAHVLKVRAEKGCLAYAPTVDAPGSALPGHPPRENVLTIVETWQTLADLEAHIRAPHQAEFMKRSGHLRAGARLEVLQDA